MSKLQIGLIEYTETMIVHSAMEIDQSYWPELEGMNTEQAMEYIRENAHDMKPTPEGEDWANNLYDELYEMDVIREKETKYQTDLYND